MRRLLTALAAFVATASPALAGLPVTLRPEIADTDGRVTLGELFDGAGSAGAQVVATRAGQTVVLDAGAVQLAARRAGLDWANAEGLRRIIVRQGASAEASAPTPVGNVEVLTYARSLASGEIVRPEDLVWGRLAAAPAEAPSDSDSIVGMSARRPLRAGSAVSLRDVSAPIVIKNGDAVTVTFQSEGVTLSLQGKALAAATVGESLSIQNPVSRKTLQAVAVAPGRAVVGPEAERVRATARTSPPQYASR